MIDAYAFGHMVIGGKRYTKDLIILPLEKIICPWWRKAAHTLSISDLHETVAASPEILVIGTGDPGLMKPEGHLCQELGAMGIEARVMPTREAANAYNTLRQQGGPIAACFHLTC